MAAAIEFRHAFTSAALLQPKTQKRDILETADLQYIAHTQVYVHYNVKTAEGRMLQSTWQAEGGAGLPLPFVIGKGRRAPRAWEIALLSKAFAVMH